MKTAIVSGCDANYYPLLRELFASLIQCKEASGIDFCIIDSGLEEGQLAEFKELGAKIVRPDWPDGIPTKKVIGKEYLKSCVCRPFIPKMFPEYDLYVWLDADAWVQNWSGVEMFIQAASKEAKPLAIINCADRACEKTIRIKWFGHFPIKVKNFYASNGRKPFGRKFAKEMVDKYVLNAGCFAMQADAPHWKRWQELVVFAAQKGKVFTAEQLSLGKMIYQEGFKAELLPSYAHWMCETRPAWCDQREQFVEPYVPHLPLGVIHMSGIDEVRADRHRTLTLDRVEGGEIEKNFRYPDFDAGSLERKRPKRA